MIIDNDVAFGTLPYKIAAVEVPQDKKVLTRY